MTLRPLAVLCALAVLAGCSPQPAVRKAPAPPAAAAPPPGEPVVPGAPGQTRAPAGLYALDPTHATLTFRLSHLGFSNYTASFSRLSGELAFDPAKPAAMRVSVSIDPRSLSLPAPPQGFHETLLGKDWLDTTKHPQMTFRSTKVEPTGPDTARVTGDMTLHGVTRPMVLEARFNGGYAPNAFDGARVGFSAKGVLRRSEFGIAYGLPAPGTNMGVGDHVEVVIETEWTRGTPTAPPPH